MALLIPPEEQVTEVVVCCVLSVFFVFGELPEVVIVMSCRCCGIVWFVGASGTAMLMWPLAIGAILKCELFDVKTEGDTSFFVAS